VPLTDVKVKNAKPREKPHKLSDERGLYLLVTPAGGKWWRFDYRFAGRRKTLSLGTYPDVSLQKARKKREAAREQVAAGTDPSQVRKAEKLAQASAESFEAIALEWHARCSPNWSDKYATKVLARLKANVFPWVGKKAAMDIEPPELLAVLRRMESRGAVDTARRVRMHCGQVFRYAIATGRAQRDPAADLKGAIVPPRVIHFPTITDPRAVGALLRAIDEFSGHFATKCALRLAPLLFVRPGELRQAEWAEFDLDAAEWRIPASKMKMAVAHIVPLSEQAVAILRELHPLTGRGRYVFPSVRSAKRPMSENTLNAALRRLGYTKDEITAHGFRSMASTLLHEQGWPSDVIERQLAHAERNNVKAAYNRAQHLSERRKMMQSWADYLDALRSGADVVTLDPAKAS